MYSSTVCNTDFIFYWFFLKTGLEIIEQVPDVEAVVIPVGGGGLIAGCAVALKTMKPNIRIIVSHSIFDSYFWLLTSNIRRWDYYTNIHMPKILLIHKTTINWYII